MPNRRVRFGTNLITFYDTAFWGLPPTVPYPQWEAEFMKRPRYFFERMFDHASSCGLEGVELAPDPAGWRAALSAFGSSAELRSVLADRGLVLTSSYAHGRQLIGNAMKDPDLQAVANDDFRRHSEFLAEIGASIIVTGNLPRSRFGNEKPDETATPEDFERRVPEELQERFAAQLNRLGAIVGRNGVKLAIHTDAYSICSRSQDIDAILRMTDPLTVQLCPDAGHITLDGGDAVAVLRSHIARIPTMHWKDCAHSYSGHLIRGDQKERHAEMLKHFRVLGSGIVDWKAWMEVLRATGWSGWATEEIDHSPDPVGDLQRGLAYFEDQLAPIYR